jgi:hypothetical protein
MWFAVTKYYSSVEIKTNEMRVVFGTYETNIQDFGGESEGKRSLGRLGRWEDKTKYIGWEGVD